MEQIKAHLKTLNLTTMASVLDEELSKTERNKLSASEFMLNLLSNEVEALANRRIERRIKEAKFPGEERKLLSSFDFAFQTGIEKEQIMELATLNFIKRKQGLILAGDSGTGKSHIAKALLLIACQQQYRCRYTTASNMLKELISGLSDDTLEVKLRKYVSPEILLIDEVGFDRLEQESSKNASLFFKAIDGRYSNGSTIITSNIDFKDLGDYLGDPVVTTAIVDRMIHHSIIISITGPSWRMHESKKINKRLKAGTIKKEERG